MTIAKLAERANRSAPRQCFNGGSVGHGTIVPMAYGRTASPPRFRSKLSSLLRSLARPGFNRFRGRA